MLRALRVLDLGRMLGQGSKLHGRWGFKEE
jgi:hypothetical protein